MAASRIARIVAAVDPSHDWTAELDSLAAAGIQNEADLVFGSAEQLASLIGEREYESLRTLVADFLTTGGRTAAQIYTEQAAREAAENTLTSGVARLDDLLDSGLRAGEVIELSGPKGAGKTLLSLQIALRMLLSNESSRALFVDTAGAFSPTRALSILESVPTHRSATPAHGKPEVATQDRAVLDRLDVARCFDLASAMQAITAGVTQQQGDDLKNNNTSQPPRLIVVDCVADLLASQLATGSGHASAHGHASMVTFVRRLSAYAKTSPSPLTILLVNTAISTSSNPLSAFAGTQSTPALGATFAYATDITIWLSPAKDLFPNVGGGASRKDGSDSKLIVAEVLRSRRTISTTWCTFRMMQNSTMITAD